MTRHLRIGTLVLAFAVPHVALAQGTQAALDELQDTIDAFRSNVEAAESGPFPPGSEGEARAALADLRAAMAPQETRIDQAAETRDAARSQIAAMIPSLPQSAEPAPPEPVVDPAPEPVIDPDDRVADQSGGEEDADGSAEMPTVTPQPDPAPQPTPGLPSLAALTAPLAEGDRARRVLIRPDAQMRTEDGTEQSLPAFSVHYVFHEEPGDGGALLAIGRTTRRAEGWIEAARTEDWRTMLVMSYAPRTGRDRTVFFSSEDDVFDVLEAGDGAADRIAEIHGRIEAGTHDPDRVVAIEPRLVVDSVERPYLMPVLDYRLTNTATHGDVAILQLAALNRDSSDVRDAGTQPVGQDRITVEADARDFRVGVAFVIDTTRSMGPYIDKAKTFVRSVSDGLASRGLSDRFDFALVGFRDNVEAASDVEYLRTIYRDFGGGVGDQTLFADVARMVPAAASTANWREDAFAGIDLAISDLNWGEVDTRLVFLITDASPRSVGDALASDPGMGPETIMAMAAQRNVSLFVLHMQTEEAISVSSRTEGYDDTARGAQLYSRLARTGDAAVSKYFKVRGATEEAFGQSLQLIAANVIDQLGTLSTVGQLDAPAGPALSPELAALLGGDAISVDDPSASPLIADAVAEEIFRYQTEYLGAQSGAEAPDFYRGWAADVDLANPERRALDVSVFMTRDQLSDLANRLEDIVERLNAKQLGMGDFFSSVQAQSGQAAVDPEFGTFLPAYLDDLPYGSKFINMTPSLWDALSQQGQVELLDEVQAKVASYRRIYAAQDGWLSLAGRAVGDQVYPLPLRDLP
ncbi:hypothetical protein [Palleronia abyssalis]|uniref:VWFA domain-containing protein n=1 Tax=Palleronia abyssalis TaxID=1501240 RepID=A0A2R8C1A4_9RHOB|nr:hypothetical protein [Palleronia abyssalis]SPJ26198.1 hypothetical protein PAA8504_04054 [Palleronia abyssalis]